MRVMVYLEGGGDSRQQAAPLREAAITWIERALPEARAQVRVAQVMEAWLVADPAALEVYFKVGFNARHLPGNTNLEEVSKADLNQKLEAATRSSQRGAYTKGRDFCLLGKVDPVRVQQRCPSAARFVQILQEKLSCSGH